MANTLGLDSLVFQFYIGIGHIRFFFFFISIDLYN